MNKGLSYNSIGKDIYHICLQILSFMIFMAGIGTSLFLTIIGCTLFILSNKSFKHKIARESRDGKCSFCRGQSFGDNDYDCDTCEISYFIKDGNKIVTNGESFEFKYYGTF